MSESARFAGRIYVSPPSIRKRWFGLRLQLIPESVAFVNCDIEVEGGEFSFVRYWDECVEAARAAGTYYDYREGTERDGEIPTGLVNPPRTVWAWNPGGEQ